MDGIMQFTQCAFCSKYVYGYIRAHPGGQTGVGFKFRYDLKAFICDDCDKELGPDEGRVKCLMLGGMSREEALEMLYGGEVGSDPSHS